MKRIKYTLIIALGLISTGCSLDIDPDFITPENYYKDDTEVETALIGVYNALIGQYSRLYVNGMFSYMSMSDEMYYTSYSPSGDIRIMDIDASTLEVQRFWEGLYKGISRANYLIYYSSGLDTDAVKEYIAEAKFLRGYYYFILVTYFGSVPMPLEPTLSPSSDYFLPQSSVKDIYAQIVKDMKEAEEGVYELSVRGTNERITKTGVQAILARVYMSMAGEVLKDPDAYQNAADYCTKVIDSGEHELNTDYKQIFINEVQDIIEPKECIWEIAFYGNNIGDQIQAGQVGVENGISCINEEVGYSAGSLRGSGTLYGSFGTGDLRRDWNLATYYYKQVPGTTDVEKTEYDPSASGAAWKRNCGKWRREYQTGSKARSYTSTNFPVIRYSDVLLMKAEALNEIKQGPNYLAYQLVDQVRRRAYGKPIDVPDEECDLEETMDHDEFFRAIKNERLSELCFEAVRKTDLLRWGIYVSSVQKMGSLLKDIFPSNSYYRIGENCAERNALFPIPTAEFSMNSNIKQNPGW